MSFKYSAKWCHKNQNIFFIATASVGLDSMLSTADAEYSDKAFFLGWQLPPHATSVDLPLYKDIFPHKNNKIRSQIVQQYFPYC